MQNVKRARITVTTFPAAKRGPVALSKFRIALGHKYSQTKNTLQINSRNAIAREDNMVVDEQGTSQTQTAEAAMTNGKVEAVPHDKWDVTAASPSQEQDLYVDIFDDP